MKMLSAVFTFDGKYCTGPHMDRWVLDMNLMIPKRETSKAIRSDMDVS